MPYFVYKIAADRELTLLGAFEDYQSAKALCNQKRPVPGLEKGSTVRLMFASNRKEAEGLLKEKRKPSTPVEEWEV